jgi:hypothetical protein
MQRQSETPLSPLPNRLHGAVDSAPSFFGGIFGFSEQAAGSHRHRLAAADDQMVQHAHADQSKRIA